MKRFFLSTSVISFCTFLLGGLLTYFFFPQIQDVSPFELRAAGNSDLTFINQLLECGDTSTSLPSEVKATEEEVRAYIQLEKSNGTLTDIGLYYRDLNNGPVFGIDPDTQFSPGSLLKVPLLLAIYKQQESDSAYLSKKIEYAGGASTAAQDVVVGQPISPGHTYTVNELLSHMIKESDNNAALLLYQLLGYDKTADTYKELGLTPPSVGSDYTITVRSYATFFRLLYNATYISKTDSNEALKLLSGAEFKDGIVAGVPSGTVVSHKFGERHFEGDTKIEQLHDCGIVYKPDHPYMLCIMTRGHDVKTLAPVIANISKIVYSHVGN